MRTSFDENTEEDLTDFGEIEDNSEDESSDEPFEVFRRRTFTKES